ncbi:MAG: tRNA 2-selenouridine(34) synthase MnmH [Chromatiales bacterium]|jgi:tRNA 2-selenouridine synthase
MTAVDLPVIDDYRRLFLNGVPLMDVRAPVEFDQGAFPRAENHPLIDDAERHEIGIRYAEAGQDAAAALGHRLVDGPTKAARVAAWAAFARRHPGGALYCFRGGMRSRISQRWLYEATGVRYPRVRGGYKALRRFLLEELEASAARIRPLIIGGRTGVGKTRVLQRLDPALDLERLAWHRGSAFGRHATPQPGQVDFENALSVALLRHRAAGNGLLAVEDESRAIGSRHIPPPLFEALKRAPLVLVETGLEERVGNILQEYVVDALAEHRAQHGARTGWERWVTDLLDSLDRIRKRLGAARHASLRALMAEALEHQRHSGETGPHRVWIRTLLAEYYDPMYDYQIERNRSRICFTGGPAEVVDEVVRMQAVAGAVDFPVQEPTLGAPAR